MNATNLVLERIINQRFVSIGMRQVSATTPRLREIRAKEIWSGNGLVSFDVFDTLITRPVQRPSDMFLLTGYRLQREFGPRVAPGEWFSIRQSAETRARKTRVEREVTLNDIYAEIAASTDLPEEFLTAAQAMEVGLEKRLLRPIAGMVETFNRFSVLGRTAIISDTYFSQADLETMLNRCGVRVNRAKLFSSCEWGCAKRTGSLFSIAKGCTVRHLHVGDGVFPDVFQVWRAGGRAAPFFNGSPSRLERELGKGAIEPPLLRSALSGSARTARLRTRAISAHDQSLAEISAGFMGPLLLAFVVWILKEARRRKIDKLFFLARDGQILLSIAKKIANSYGLQIDLDYLHVSRQSLHLPALLDIAGSDLGHFGLEAGISLSDVFGKFDLGVDHPAIVRLQKRLGIGSPHSPMNSPEMQQLIQQIQTDGEVSDLINTTAASARQLLLEYLKQKGFFAEGNIGVVDIGWRGNLQRSLAKVACSIEANFDRRLSGLYFGLYHRPENCGSLDDYLSESVAAPIRPFIRGPIFEAICAADHGTTTGYRRAADGLVYPQLLTDDNPQALAWGLKLQQDVINAYVDDVLAVLTEAGIEILDSLEGLTHAAAIVTRLVIGSPSRSEAIALGSFPHASDQLHKVFEEVAPALPLSTRQWVARLRARDGKPLISEWPEASVVRAVPSVGAGVLLGSLGVARWLRTHLTTR
ncbi:HAD family hydrolase [Paraburkholderia phenoliruptrix]|uniref:HAD family hydrolase n=1 Tax=Paraburkholderia phenoliruptrix TaxID=252970 RepID=UPI001C6E494B|nr:haloacid dehalogenase [Paraburkholderia phenoliruptrix]MBW9104861.1 haloacid dehalogenase [Paraburkholderia phenoliruptrix]MBW9131887.1 haloacid dehalogenase [Paraburkholderia ginsengiterrae]